MLSLEEINDRIEIIDMLHRYAGAIDAGEWDVLDTVFTPDAPIDYSAMGGASLPFGEMKPWLESMISHVPGRMHLISNIQVAFSSDRKTATSTAYLMNAMVFSPDNTTLIGGVYNDSLVRTTDGWRVRERRLDMVWKS